MFKRYISVALVSCLAMSSMMLYAGAVDEDTAVSLSNELQNNSSLSDEAAQAYWLEAKESLLASHDGVYELNHFSAVFSNSEYGGINLDVTADSTLLLDPEENPYFAGMRSALETLDVASREALQPIYDAQLYDAAQAYQTPVNTTYLFYVDDPAATRMQAQNLYARIEVSETAPILCEVDRSAPLTGTQATKMGYDTVLQLAAPDTAQLHAEPRAVTYKRLTAAQYAIDHGKDYPEMVSLGYGTDCANFVSWCICSGGIPRDWSSAETGWYNSVNGAYPSNNWMRTGYNGNGGVRPYMVNHGYFKKSAVTTGTKGAYAGAFLYWKGTSHVAFVTAGDGQSIYYSEHGSNQKNYTNVEFPSSKYSLVDVYLPTSYVNS